MAHPFESFLQSLPVAELAEKFGVSEQDMTHAVSLAAPALLGGMAVNASTDEGAAKLVAATEQHERRATSLDDVDTSDGKKIVKKVLGSKEQDVLGALERRASDSSIAALMPKLLPILAPLIMQYVSGQLSQRDSPKERQPGALGEVLGGLGGILGGLLGK